MTRFHLFNRILVGSLALFALFLLPLAAFAQDAAAPDIGSLLKLMVEAAGDFRTGALLAGIAVVVNLLTNVTKLPFLDKFINVKARPFIALALGVIGAVVTAKLNGQPWIAAVGAGITVGLGSVGFHEVVQSLTATKPAALLADVVQKAADGDQAALAKVQVLTDNLDAIQRLPADQRASALAAYATAHPPVPPAAMGG